jgi:hypothetical protein
VLRCDACAPGECGALGAQVPTALVRRTDADRIALDLGACLFSPEEAVGSPGCGITFSPDPRMAAGTREALVSAEGTWELARALDARMQSLLGRSLRLRSVVAGNCGGCEAG